MRTNSALLRIATAGAIALAPVAIAHPAGAAPATPSGASTGVSVSPFSYGSVQCSSGDVFCLQRITSVENGTAYISTWADKHTWTGWFALYRNGNHIEDSPFEQWPAGGHSWVPNAIAEGTGYYVIAWQNRTTPHQIARIDFRI